jgi:hypothetical protein
MGGSPSIPSPPPPPDPAAVAQANAEAYKKNIDTYIEKSPELAALENQLRATYLPAQRALERELSALDQQAGVRSGLQIEQKYGPQRTLETLRRQYETSPQAYALNRSLGDQMTRQFGLLYGVDPYASVEQNVANAKRSAPIEDMLGQ